ncbi:MAG TPA: FAD-binding oxidoreductase [Anaerovoracaceae bacterium]|nr:FAD-binding oxidoreductase [Anaerovoracaceae bacterium]
MKNELIRNLDDQYEDYLSDESKMKGFASSISFPKTKEEVAEIVRRMRGDTVSITVQGGKTGICGAGVPFGGHIMNLSRMTKAEALRKTEDGYTLKVQAGLPLSELRKMLSAKRFNTAGWDRESLAVLDAFQKDAAYFWPPDPTETSAAIGGMIGTNAQSITDFRYGRIKEYIDEIELVDSSGGIFTTRDLDLYLGSEGMYGIFVGAALRLVRKPLKMWGICFFFEEEARLLHFAEQALKIPKQGSSSIAAVEYIGRQALNYIRKLGQVSSKLQELPDIGKKYKGIAYVELHGDSEAEIMVLVEQLAAGLTMEEQKSSWVLFGESGIGKIKLLRHSVPESVNMAIKQRAMKDSRITKLSTDLTTRNRLTEDVLRYQRDADSEHLEAVIFGHVPENRLHVNIIPNTYEEYERGKRLIETWYRRALESGGTVFREHGVGKVKKLFFRDIIGEDAQKRILENKKTLDPQNLLNPGNML